MFSHRVVMATVLTSLFALPALPASAQSTLGGKVTGVCMLSRNQVLAKSKVGQAANKRLQQLAESARADIGKTRKPLQNDIRKFQQQAQSMPVKQRESKQKALQDRMQSVQRQTRQLDVRLRITRSRAMSRIGTEISPLLSSVYKRRHCGVLIDRDNVLGGNETNDLTGDVVQALDKKISTISFSLAPLPKQTPRQ